MSLGDDFYARSVHEVARDLVGCVVRHGETAGRIVETESYHKDEPACHAYVGLTAAHAGLFGPPGRAYVYRSYGIHALLNAVCEEEGVGAAVLIRALEPVDGIDADARAARPASATTRPLLGARQADPGARDRALAERQLAPGRPDRGARARAGASRRGSSSASAIGITKAADLPWRFCDADSRTCRAPGRPQMRAAAYAAGVAAAGVHAAAGARRRRVGRRRGASAPARRRRRLRCGVLGRRLGRRARRWAASPPSPCALAVGRPWSVGCCCARGRALGSTVWRRA